MDRRTREGKQGGRRALTPLLGDGPAELRELLRRATEATASPPRPTKDERRTIRFEAYVLEMALELGRRWADSHEPLGFAAVVRECVVRAYAAEHDRGGAS